MHIEREEQSVALMIKDSADVNHHNSGLHAHLAELRVQNDAVLDKNKRLQADLETQLACKERDMQAAKSMHHASMVAKEHEYVAARHMID